MFDERFSVWYNATREPYFKRRLSVNLDNFMGASGREETRRMYSQMPLYQYVDVWINTFKKDSVKPATLARLETSKIALAKYPIAAMKLEDITAFDLQLYVNQLTSAGYGLTTIKKQLRIATAPLRQAAAMHFIQADPSIGVKLPTRDKVSKPARDARPYTEEEQKKLWQIINTTKKHGILCIGLMLETGLRCGEALALRWQNVNIEKKRLQVAATILNIADKKRSVLQESPKTASSRRTVPLTPKAIEILNKLKENNDTEWVFLGRKQERLSYEALRYQTIQACENANVQYLGEHAFRHTFATNCYYRNVDVKVLSKILGHSDVNITYNIYISLQGDGFDEMYDALTSVS